MALNNKRQSNLEKRGIEERQKEIVRSDYNKIDAYSDSHVDALSNPEDKNKPLGKGTGDGGHSAYVPNSAKSSTAYNYNSLNTAEGGGSYDIHGRNEQSGRNRLMAINIYSKDNAYGPNSIDTSENLDEGQYVVKM
jgi:hypothetical protein